jgi:hypothetical protein
MKIDKQLKPAFWGAVVGAVAISIIGFSSFGWTLQSTAEEMADQRAGTAVVDALTPICVAKFQQQADYAAQLAQFKNIPSYNQAEAIEKGGWAAFPGIEKANSAVASACAKELGRLKA